MEVSHKQIDVWIDDDPSLGLSFCGVFKAAIEYVWGVRYQRSWKMANIKNSKAVCTTVYMNFEKFHRYPA